MKHLALLAFVAICLPGFSQATSSWVRTQTVDKLSGDPLVIYMLDAQPDENSGRRASIAAVCDKTAGRFNYGYFTDDMVHVDAEFSHPDTSYYPTTVRYREAAKVRSAATTVRADFRTINLDPAFMTYFMGGQGLVISFQSERGYMATDSFYAPLPLQYIDDCYSDKMKRKMQKGR